MLGRGKVVLFYPKYEGAPLGAPLCLLALAATLRNADYEPVMIDAAIVPNYLEVIAGHMEDAICLGISVLTGPMSGGAIEVATEMKKRFPLVPILVMSGSSIAGKVNFLDFARKLGADAHIQKPFKPAAFLERVESLLQHSA